MTRLTERKTRLTFETEAMVQYRGDVRPIVVETDSSGFLLALRLKGTRVRYELSWHSAYQLAAEKFAAKKRAERKARRTA